MNCESWIETLYSDQSLTDNLTPDDTERLLSWSESQLTECETGVEAPRLMESIRLLNRYVKEGEPFDDLFAALRANFQRTGATVPAGSVSEDIDVKNLYPDEPAADE